MIKPRTKIAKFYRSSSQVKSWVMYALAFAFFASISWYTPQLRNLDIRIFDSISQSQKHIPSDEIVIVVADDTTIAHVGGFPLDRKFISQVFQALYEANPKRIFLDIFLVSQGSSSVDKQLASVIGQFGSNRLAISALNPTLRSEAKMPHNLFSAQATLLGSELFVDDDGWHRTVTVAQTEPAPFANPSRWLAGTYGNMPIHIDQRIDLTQYRRVTMLDVARGNVKGLANKTIIIGLDSKIGGVSVNYPLHGNQDRMTLMALGADTVLRNSEPIQFQPLVIIGLVAFMGLAALLGVHIASSAFQLGMISAAGSITIVVSSFYAMSYLNLPSKGFYLLAVWGVAITIATAQKLRFAEVLREFYAGDLTPEEAWAWRTMDDHSSAAILLSATGLKRQNKTALSLRFFPQNHILLHDESRRNINTLRFAVSNNTLAKPIKIKVNDRTLYLSASMPFEGLALLQFEDVTERIQEADMIQKRLETDQLTGCGNRAAFEAMLRALDENSQPYCTILMDMNGFKAVNDTYGHQAGDGLLKYAAKQFQKILREGDLLVRLGGDEFAVVMAGNIGHNSALRVCHMLEATLTEPVKLGTQTVRVGVAAGYALSALGQHHSAIVDKADKAMYARKTEIKTQIKQQKAQAEEMV